LRDGRLLSIAGKHLRGGGGEIVAARRRDAPHGPIANRLWSFIAAQAPALNATIKRRGPKSRGHFRVGEVPRPIHQAG